MLSVSGSLRVPGLLFLRFVLRVVGIVLRLLQFALSVLFVALGIVGNIPGAIFYVRRSTSGPLPISES